MRSQSHYTAASPAGRRPACYPITTRQEAMSAATSPGPSSPAPASQERTGHADEPARRAPVPDGAGWRPASRSALAAGAGRRSRRSDLLARDRQPRRLVRRDGRLPGRARHRRLRAGPARLGAERRSARPHQRLRTGHRRRSSYAWTWSAREQPGRPLFLIGSSWAAKLAVAIAARQQDRLAGLILHGPVLFPRVDLSLLQKLVVLALHRSDPERQIPIPLSPTSIPATRPGCAYIDATPTAC